LQHCLSQFIINVAGLIINEDADRQITKDSEKDVTNLCEFLAEQTLLSRSQKTCLTTSVW